MNKNKKDMLASVGIAAPFTILSILHKKIGGLRAGADYSDPHTWGEIMKMAPTFFMQFFVAFLACLIYFFLKKSDK